MESCFLNCELLRQHHVVRVGDVFFEFLQRLALAKTPGTSFSARQANHHPASIRE